MFFRRIVFLLLLIASRLFASGTVARNARWEEIDITGNGEFGGGLVVSERGRLAYFTFKNGREVILTAMLGATPWQWTTVAELSPFLTFSHRKLLCSDEDCYYTAVTGQTVGIWKATNLNSPLPVRQLILQTGDSTNLGTVRQFESFTLDRSQLFVYADIGSSGLGLYEITGVQTLSLRVSQAVTNTLEWDRQKLFVLNNTFLFAGQREVVEVIVPGRTQVVKRYGVFRTSLGSSGPAEQLARMFELVDGKSTTNCCLISQGPLGFLIQHSVSVRPDPGATAILRFLDERTGRLTKVTEAPDIIEDPRVPGSTYTVGVAPSSGNPTASSPNQMLYRIREGTPYGRKTDTVFFWNPTTARREMIVKPGDLIYGNSSFDRAGGGITADFRVVLQTAGQIGDVASVRLAVGILPTPISFQPLSGRPGDTLTIRGVNLFIPGLTTTVLVGGFAATPTATADGLTFRVPTSVPTGPQQVVLELKDSTGTISLSAGTLEVVNLYPLPVARTAASAAAYPAGMKIAPGGLASLFGANLTSLPPTQAGSLPLPLELANTRVLVGNRSAPLWYVSGTQINFQVPAETAPGETSVQVATKLPDGTELLSVPLVVTVAAMAPALFSDEQGKVMIVDHRTGEQVTTQRPARYGEFVTVFGTGFGPTSPPVATGQPAPLADPLATLVNPPTLRIGGQARQLFYAGLAPGLPGVYQLNFQVPEGALKQEPVELVFTGLESIVFYLPAIPPE